MTRTEVAPLDDGPAVVPDLTPDDAPVAIAESNDNSEGGRLKMIVQLLKKCLGVKDIASMRISLPASLLEPIPNLEYWSYLDRPDLFVAINDSTDPFERMLAVLRFTFSKDLKFIHGKVVKPYNSVLGEHFRAHWTIKPVTYTSDPTEPPICHSYTQDPSPSVPQSETASSQSGRSKRSDARLRNGSTSVNGVDLISALTSDASNISVGGNSSTSDSEPVRVVFLTEQVSHHPPISSYYYGAPDRGIEACGVDQISAKVSGTSVKVSPGSLNKGIFIALTSGPGSGEKYQITHPVALVNGMLRGSPYACICETSIITCVNPNSQQHLRTIIEYKDESWIGKAQYLLAGVIHEYDPLDIDHLEWVRPKHVPAEKILATLEGCWKKRIYWKRTGDSTKHTLIDLSALSILPKTVRPLEEQHPFESRKLWGNVTSNLLKRNFSEATKHKQSIEQAQRDDAADRKKKGKEFVPVYFEPDISTGAPKLTGAGRQAVKAELVMKP
ncbi:uncharacterized protein EI90DRAFT_2931268 [Cantharellus anzutake]|uniref:uncharacterized protein n=1 Tax=Cantharellus anzutake TaxID=1750568 RepID=UPI001907AF34|nr:uncharacterized protein EI90DRAFT_2931268 [Cantharellus anzutake]KAF8325785.1 hypothetical protein EI90DRAFT_2931268 [Cantharellus anzutake]